MPQCGDGEFECDNGRCIRKTQVCDTVTNCDDGSDENVTLCGTSTFVCAAPAFFRCGMYFPWCARIFAALNIKINFYLDSKWIMCAGISSL